jgi:cysteine desulfurase family protein (TIGR01976 family)
MTSSISTASTTQLDLDWVRAQFPSLKHRVNGRPAVFFDGPGGTQVPRRVIDAISGYLSGYNANSGGAYDTSRRTDAMLAEARSAMADFLGCDSDEVVFGANMTALTYALSRSLGRELGPGNEILLTHLDHDANVSPWRALEETGAVARMVEINQADCTLDMNDLVRKLGGHTRLLAVGYASNAVGTVNPVAKIVSLAREAGALSFIDAVHYAPHGPIDVKALHCDFLACSTYKFFGPHMGVLFGRRDHLERLRPYKVRANTNAVPQRWEWGTLNHECLAGVIAAVDYLAELGSRCGPGVATRRDAVLQAYTAIHQHEHKLLARLIAGLAEIPRLKIYGITDPARFDERCPTIALRIDGFTPLDLATRLGEKGVFCWDGNYYALNLTERLGVEQSGGFLRLGLVHYNTEEEVDRVVDELVGIAAGR